MGICLISNRSHTQESFDNPWPGKEKQQQVLGSGVPHIGLFSWKSGPAGYTQAAIGTQFFPLLFFKTKLQYYIQTAGVLLFVLLSKKKHPDFN